MGRLSKPSQQTRRQNAAAATSTPSSSRDVYLGPPATAAGPSRRIPVAERVDPNQQIHPANGAATEHDHVGRSSMASAWLEEAADQLAARATGTAPPHTDPWSLLEKEAEELLEGFGGELLRCARAPETSPLELRDDAGGCGADRRHPEWACASENIMDGVPPRPQRATSADAKGVFNAIRHLKVRCMICLDAEDQDYATLCTGEGYCHEFHAACLR